MKRKEGSWVDDSQPLGTVFNPHKVEEGYIVQFLYEGGYFEVQLTKDGRLNVRTSGSHSDRMAVRPNVSNDISIIPLRWDNEVGDHMPMRQEKEQ